MKKIVFAVLMALAMVAVFINPVFSAEPKHVINTDGVPFIPKGWAVEQHQKSGQLEWNSEAVKLYLPEKQQNGGKIIGHELRKELVNKSVLNACVLEWLLDNPQLIPQSWKDKEVPFWGTIYRDSTGRLAVRYLSWNIQNDWIWGYRWLDERWYDRHPAAYVDESHLIMRCKSDCNYYPISPDSELYKLIEKEKRQKNLAPKSTPKCEACDGD